MRHKVVMEFASLTGPEAVKEKDFADDQHDEMVEYINKALRGEHGMCSADKYPTWLHLYSYEPSTEGEEMPLTTLRDEGLLDPALMF